MAVLPGQRSGKASGAKEPRPLQRLPTDGFAIHPICFRFLFAIPKARPYNNFFLPAFLSLDIARVRAADVARRLKPNRRAASIRRQKVQANRRSWVSEAVRTSRMVFKHLPEEPNS
jgi:hypothetical protein